MIHEQLYLGFFVESLMSDLPTIGPNVWASRPVPAATRRSILTFTFITMLTLSSCQLTTVYDSATYIITHQQPHVIRL